MPSLPGCPWCQSELLHTFKGMWRCPFCTGFFMITGGGKLKRLYVQPGHPLVYVLMWILVAAGALGIPAAIIMSR